MICLIRIDDNYGHIVSRHRTLAAARVARESRAIKSRCNLPESMYAICESSGAIGERVRITGARLNLDGDD